MALSGCIRLAQAASGPLTPRTIHAMTAVLLGIHLMAIAAKILIQCISLTTEAS